MNLKDINWTEKYRPTKVEEVVGDFKDKIVSYLKSPQNIPNFIFYSKTPGTGKTTLMKAIVNELGCDYLILNSSDDRKIEVVREKIKEFAKTKSSNGKRKCCLMDEADGMLKASQDALRNLMETYSSNIFFILTCNHIDKIIDPLQSRCVIIPFTQPDKKEIYTYLEGICLKEKLEYTEEAMKKLIDINYPSIRNCVNFLQDIHTAGKGLTEEVVKKFDDEYNEVWQAIKKGQFSAVRKTILTTGMDCLLLNRWIFYNLFNEEIELKKLIKLIQITAKNERDIKLGADANIIFIASIPEMCMVLK